MKLLSLSIQNQPPITNLTVSALAETVVIAGPNGVGRVDTPAGFVCLSFSNDEYCLLY
jgi:hypothetical protein